ncbi:MAG: cell division protein FtsQ/DivIB [Planctomycetota bacterium]|jgi:hypothetical protein
MAARKKRNKSKTKRISFKPGTSKRKKQKRQASPLGPSLRSILKVLAVVCVLAGIVIGLIFLERYIKETVLSSEGILTLELADVPAWVSDELKEKVFTAARGVGENLGLHEDAALSVQRNIEKLVGWLDEVKVQSMHDGLRIEGRWRRPIALVKSGLLKFYVDAEHVVLDFVEMQKLPIVEIKGLSRVTKVPPMGEVWHRDDLAAAVIILGRLDRMDKSLTPDKPLLYEIDSIDVSNFNGRKSRRQPHIILYAKDNTEIIWGAEFGTWQQHLESTDEQKLAKLYGYYKEYGTLTGGAKYINLRDPQDNIPLPIDKY